MPVSRISQEEACVRCPARLDATTDETNATAEDCEQIERVVLEVVEKTGRLIATDCGDPTHWRGFYGTWMR
jgi:hypothetical protein